MKTFATALLGLGLAAAGFGLGAFAADAPKTENRVEAKGDIRAFEMRTYYAAPGKMADLHKRFKDITNKWFAKFNMTPVGYWVDAKEPERKLVYILAFPSKEAGERSWKAFIADPERVAEFKETEKNGKLVEKIESVWLTPTEYSAIK